jgi:hypothetical protein
LGDFRGLKHKLLAFTFVSFILDHTVVMVVLMDDGGDGGAGGSDSGDGSASESVKC